MAPAELFAEGINLMVAGMGFVMLFLLVLIYAISFISKIINQYFPEPVSIPASKTVPQSPRFRAFTPCDCRCDCSSSSN